MLRNEIIVVLPIQQKDSISVRIGVSTKLLGTVLSWCKENIIREATRLGASSAASDDELIVSLHGEK